MRPSFLHASAVLAAIALPLASCANLTLKPRLTPQVQSIKGLHADLEAEWTGIGDLLTSVEGQVAAFAALPIDREALSSPLIIDAIVNVFDEGVLAGDAASGTLAAGEQLAEGLKGVDAATRETIEAFVDTGRSIRNQLRGDLPSAIESGLREAAMATAAVAETQLIAEEKLSFARKHPLMTDADQQSLKLEYATLQQELKQLTAFTDRVSLEAENYNSRLASAFDQFNEQWAAIEDAN
jgi:hypothetical protein